MSGVATAIVGGAVASAVIGSNASKSAANTEANAANAATAASQSQYQQTRQDNMPWLQSGQQALGELNAQMPNLNQPFSYSMYQQSPAYQAQLQAGLNAITRSSAARGTLGGDTMKALTNYGQNAANADYQQAFNNYNTSNTNTFNRLASMAGVGQTAAAQNTQAGMNNATNISNNVMSAGNAQAAGQMAGANAISNAIGSGMNTWMQNQYMNRFGPSTPSGGYDPSVGNPVASWQPQGLTMPALGE